MPDMVVAMAAFCFICIVSRYATSSRMLQSCPVISFSFEFIFVLAKLHAKGQNEENVVVLTCALTSVCTMCGSVTQRWQLYVQSTIT